MHISLKFLLHISQKPPQQVKIQSVVFRSSSQVSSTDIRSLADAFSVGQTNCSCGDNEKMSCTVTR